MTTAERMGMDARRWSGIVGAVLLGALLAPTGAVAGGLPELADGPTERVSVTTSGGQLAEDATAPAVSADGRWVAFTSADPALAPDCPGKGPEVGSQVYLRDRVAHRTILVSATPHGCASTGGGGPGMPSVSANGRYVAFESPAHDLVPGFAPPLPVLAIYVFDRDRRRTVAVSVGYDGRANNADSEAPSISADGRYVAFESGASNLARDDHSIASNGLRAVYVRDLVIGRTERIGPNLRAKHHDTNSPSISGNGRYVAFACTYPLLVPNAGYGDTGPIPTYREYVQEIYVYDRVTHALRMASMSPERYLGNSTSWLARTGRALSDDGRYLVFTSEATNLLPGDDTPRSEYVVDWTTDVYLFDRVANKLVRVSVGPAGVPADEYSIDATISGDGRWVAFTSAATDLGDIDATPPIPPSDPVGLDIYVHNRIDGSNRLVSRSTEGVQGDLSSSTPVLDRDGSVVVFASTANNLVLGDTNALTDIFAHDR